jgi:predicted DNA-binding protein with PD1-like motif
MQVKALDGYYLVRFETGDEVQAGLKDLAERNGIGFAALYGIGAFQKVTLGYFDEGAKTYHTQAIEEQVEVLSLSGNLSRGEGGEVVSHVHVVVGRADYSLLGGHLVGAVVRPTLEVVVTVLPTTV